MKKILFYLIISLIFIFGTPEKAFSTITIQGPSAGQNVQIGSSLYFYFTYSTYSPNFKGDIYKGNTLIKTVEYLYNGVTKTTNDLPPGNDYRVKIYGIYTPSDFGWSDYFNVIALPAPTITSANYVGNSSFQLNWSAVSGASSYRLDVSTSSDFSVFVINDASYSSNSYNQLSGFSSGVTYYCRVRAVGSYGTSSSSPTFTVTTMPAAPAVLSATAITSNSFVANWSNSVSATSYHLDVATDNGFTNFVSGYHDYLAYGNFGFVSGLTPNTPYYYRLRAESPTGVSVNSGTISTGTLPVAPVITSTLNLGATSFLLNWSPVSGASSYRLDISTSNTFTNFVLNDISFTSNSYNQLSNLTPGTTYYCRVRTVGTYGVSDNSSIFSATTMPDVPIPNQASSVTTNSFVASWNGTQSATGGYLLDVALDNGFSNYLPGYHDLLVQGTSISISALTPNTSYYYRIRSVGTSGNSVSSGTITTETLLPAPIINQPTSVTTNSFNINWVGVTGALSYRIDVATNSSFTEVILSNIYYQNYLSSATISTGISSSTTYWYRVRAYNSSAPSENSPASSVRTLAIPPTTLNASEINSLSFVANWTATPSVQSYRLDVSTESSFSSFLPGYNDKMVYTTSQIVIVPATNTNYYYRVRNFDGELTSINSNISRVGLIVINYPSRNQIIPAGSNFIISFHSPQYVYHGKAEVYQVGNPNPVVTINSSIYGDNNNSVSSASIPIGDNYRVRVYDETMQVSEGWSEIFSVVGNSVNYVKTTQINVENVLTSAEADNLTIGDKNVRYDFFDGLGRPIQTVEQQMSDTHRDFVQVIAYDKYGKNSVNYLPYTSGADGWYKEDFIEKENSEYYTATSPQFNFYQTTNKVNLDDSPFEATLFEKSPLGRPNKKGASGNVFQPDNSSYTSPTDHSIAYAYEFNGPNEVLKWSYTSSPSMKSLGLVNASVGATPIYYGAFELYRSHMKDENHNEIIEYKNKKGQVLLRKMQGTSEYALTYFIYDDFDHLVCVLPPEAVKAIVKTPTSDYFNKTNSVKEAFLKRWALRYNYDQRSRMIKKQVPGVGAVFMVYDQRDRLVLLQDSVQRASTPKYWKFTKYDLQNRPIMTGIKDTTVLLSQSDMQTVVNNHFNKASSRWGESIGGTVHGYSNYAYPVINDVNKYLTVTYYDNYQFKKNLYDTARFDYKNNELANDQPTSYSDQIKGKITGAKVKVLDGGLSGGLTWLYNVVYYDEYARAIQSIETNFKGGQDYNTNKYDFAGKLIKTKTTHTESDVTWVDRVKSIPAGNKLLNNSSTAGWGLSGAASAQVLQSGQSGWVEVTVGETNTQRMIGFNNVNSDAQFNNIDFAIYLNGTTLGVYENGVSKFTLANGITSGDILRIERNGTAIVYKKNGLPFGPNTSTSNTQLLVDVSFNTINGSLTGVKSSFSTSLHSITRKFDYDHAGRLVRTWHQIDVGLATQQPEILLSKNEFNELGQLVDKKLHSTTANGTDAKQSIDYRYNARGWLTSINNSKLNGTETINDDDDDLFGIELGYDNELGTGNTSFPQYNGNVSGAKWSSDLSNGVIKEEGYNYRYNTFNQILSATYKEKKASWVIPVNLSYSENGYTYDLNGNIKALTRRGKDGVIIDSLTYNYGSGTSQSNKLIAIVDSGDKFEGFVDNATLATEYTYDANGRMLTDQNKGITSSITYNVLNLPEVITKGENSIRYIYDASGRRISQYVNQVNEIQQVDYVGEFQYEDDVLRTIIHDEGRILVSSEKLVFQHHGDVANDITAATSNLSLVTQNGTQTYINVTSSGTSSSQGIASIGNGLNVSAGDRYRIRLKGYRTGTSPVYLLAKINGVSINWPGSSLPLNMAAESWIEQVVTIESSPAILETGIAWNTVTNNEQFFINEFEIVKLGNSDPEYQYNIKDHLGNSRVTFTTKPEIEDVIATLEDSLESQENITFLRYDMAKRVESALYDHTNGTSSGHAVRLNGTSNERNGLARSFSVMPGDTIKVEVQAKYAEGNSQNWSAAMNTLMTQISNNTTGVVIDGGGYSLSGTTSLPVTPIDHSSESGDVPKAYINYIFIDRNFNPASVHTKATRITEAAKENGYVDGVEVANGRPHELMVLNEIVNEPGYVYIYLSNDNLELEGTKVDVFFDDFRITHSKSAIIESTDYYPMGLEFSNYVRENSVSNQLRFQGMEVSNELGIDLYLTEFRSYDRSIGRWNQVDPKSSERESPYVAFANNALRYIDPKGDTIRDKNSIVKKFREFINNRISALQVFTMNPGYDWSKAYITKEATETTIANLQGVLSELNQMHSSTQVYNVAYSANVPVGEGATSYNENTGDVDIEFGRFSVFNDNVGLVGHELLHGFQYETNQISIARQNNFIGLLYDVGDEAAAYKREHLIQGMVGAGSHINTNWVIAQGAGMSPPAYQNMPRGPLDINSIQGTRLRVNTAIDGMFGRPPREVFNGWQKSYNSGRQP